MNRHGDAKLIFDTAGVRLKLFCSGSKWSSGDA